MSYSIGDAPTVTYSPPGTVDATVALTVTDPAGTTTTATVLHTAVGAYSAVLRFGAAGMWTLTWTAVGPVTDTTITRILVAGATPETQVAPSWAPTLEDVAVHIPTRTHEVGDLDASDYRVTFTGGTQPSDLEVRRLIQHACAYVMGLTGSPVVADAYTQCSIAAALVAASWVELAYPGTDAGYDRLRVAAKAATDASAAINTAAGGGTLMLDPPTFGFPDPPLWKDTFAFW